MLNIERGRDSLGVVNDRGIHRFLGSATKNMIDPAFPADMFDGSMVLAHTRNSSVGAISLRNTHPFQSGNIVGAHNGRVNNYYELKTYYEKKFPEVGKFEVDSEIIFFLLSKFGYKGLEEVEGKAAIWFYEVDKPTTIWFWIWNQDFAVSEGENMAFSSDEDHLKVAGYTKVDPLKDDGQLVYFDRNNPANGFVKKMNVSGKKTVVVSYPAVVSNSLEGWTRQPRGHYTLGAGRAHNDEARMAAGDVWDNEKKLWIKKDNIEHAVTVKPEQANDQTSHRILIAWLHFGKQVFTCATCNMMIRDADSTLDALGRRIHKGCYGTCNAITDANMLDLVMASNNAIREFIGENKERYSLGEIRAFIEDDPTKIPAKKETYSVCTTCTKECVTKHTGIKLLTCNLYENDKSDKHAVNNDPLRNSLFKEDSQCDDCILASCKDRFKINEMEICTNKNSGFDRNAYE